MSHNGERSASIFEDGFYLKCSNIEIWRGNVDEVVLNHVDKCWDGDTHAVQRLLDNVFIEMGTASTHRHAFFQPDYDETRDNLEYFRHNDGRRRRKHVAGTRSDVAHDDNKCRIL